VATGKKNKKLHQQKTSRLKNILEKVRAFFVDFWPIFFLILITLTLSYLNYDKGTYLSGWDNLHPEFNPSLYLKRNLFAVWQEYQSTGLLGGMAHAADLPRVILIYLVSLTNLVPNNLIRYLTTFLPLVLGPIGVHLLLKQIFVNSKLSHKSIQSSTFLAGLFYLLNLSTLQTFFIPFETFTWFYGALPFLIYFLLVYFKTPKLSNFLRLFLISFLSGTAFYVETLFLVFLICLIPFFIEHVFRTKKYFVNSLHVIQSGLAIILPHLYWLLPVAFFVFTNSQIATQNHINSISSIETYYRNLEFANPKSLLTLHSYLFKYLDLGINNKYDFLLGPWLNHLNSPTITAIGIFFGVIILLGIYYSLKTKLAYHRSFLGILAFCSFFLLGGGLLINSTIPLIGELLRSPYTKFSLPLAFSLSYFFAVGIIFILDIFAFLDTRLTYNLTLFTFAFLLFTYMSPAFSGNFTNKNMRVNIPSEYFELFEYLNNKPADHRIANFPQHTFWGWNYYSWGHRGSGFTWYGIKQPILDRAFDVWEKTSQDYYEEISTALYSQNHQKFNETIDKYNIAHLLLDTSVIAPDTKASLGTNYLDRIIATSEQYELEKTFSNHLLLYKNKNHKSKDFLSSKPTQDKQQQKPLLSFSQRPNQNWYEKAGFLNTNITLPSSTTSFTIPSLTDSESLLPYKIEYRPNGDSVTLKLTPITPIFYLNGSQLDLDYTSQVINIPLTTSTSKLILSLNSQYISFDLPSEVPALSEYYFLSEMYLPTNNNFSLAVYQGIPTQQYPIINSLINNNPVQCYTKKENRSIEKIATPRSITLLGTDLVACLSATLPPVDQNQLLAVSFTYYSPTLTTANINISNDDFGTENTSQPFESSTTPKRAQIFTKASTQNKQVNLILEAEETKSIQEITYKDVFVSSHDTVYQISIKLSPIKEKTVDLPQQENNKLQISLPITKTTYNIVQTPTVNALFPENRNCDRFNNGKTVKINKDDHIVYQSQNAIECDYLNLRHLPHSLNYLIGIDTKNIRGLPLVTCLENHATRRCDIYERLGNQNGQQYILQTINNKSEQDGFTLHLFNQSFGNKIGENQLKSITLHPFPLTFLQNITLNNSQENRSEIRDLKSEISSTHPFEFFYKLEIKSTGSSEINLFQTKSPYWKAIQISPEDYSKSSLLLATKYFFLYPKTFKFAPVDTANWYNTWAIPSGGNHIIIIYLPQYLEFLGLAIILLTMLITLPLLLYQKIKEEK